MALKSKEIVIHELQQQVKAHETVMMAWLNCPYPEFLFEAAQESNKMSLHFRNAITAVERYA